jgi:hypothetical protein
MNQFDQFLQIKLKSLPLKLGSIELLTPEMAEITVENHGTLKVSITRKAYSELLATAGLTKKTLTFFNNNFISEEEDRAAGLVVFNNLKEQNSSTEVVAAIKDAHIVRFATPAKHAASISNYKLVEILEYCVGHSNHLEIKSVNINPYGTEATFNLIDNRKLTISIPGEDIAVGWTIHWDFLNGTTVQPYAERQVCSNGMTAPKNVGDSVVLTSDTSAETWREYLMDDRRMKRVVEKYEKAVIAASQALLSLKEYDEIKEIAMDHYLEDEKFINEEMPFNFLKDYIQNGIDHTSLTQKQKGSCPTPVSAWDAINMLTWLASHPEERKTKHGGWHDDKVKKEAGKILFSFWDCDSWVFNAPTYPFPEVNITKDEVEDLKNEFFEGTQVFEEDNQN